MDWLIRKRDGRIVTFSKHKIEKAVERTLRSTSTEADAREISDQVEAALYMNYFKTGSIPTVEHIKDFIEETLILRKLTSAARAFILYREKREEARDVDHLLSGMECIVQDYLGKVDWRVKENSNMNYSLQGLNFYLSSSITRKYWLSRIYTPRIRELQENGDFHIHDLGILGPYCVGWDLMTLLKEGFRGARGKTESSPPAHLRTALGQVVNFFYTLQGEAAGAQAFSSFDTLLAPFIRYDGLDYAQIRQSFQEFLFNVNIPTRVGFQAPFTNITMDLKPSKALSDQRVIIGGKEMKDVYGDFQPEMDMINSAFAELMMEGDSKGRIFTFPIPTYNLTRDFEWDNENLKPIWEMTGKYGVPYFSNFVNSDMSPDDARSMCCRLRLDNRELRNRGGGLFGSNPLTGSIGVVTINLPRIGYTSAEEDEFFDRLSYVMEAARESLELKRDLIEQLTEQGLYPYTSHYLRTIKSQQGHYWSNHFSTIGLLGMNECCMNFLGESIATEEGREWSIKVLQFMRERLAGFQEETGNLYNLEASPAEGASYSLARKDREQFPDAYSMGSSNPYYTNSVHLPVTERRDIFSLLEHQDPLQTMFTGGTVVHVFIGEAITDWRMVRKLARSIVSRYHLPYFSFTPTFSICPVHGYIAGEHFLCPYPHTEEELAEFGEIVDADDFQPLPEGSFARVEDTEVQEQGSLFLKIGKVSTDV
ncbi:MAG: anaerobic ribonucleoside triphosphate reductase [Candidatus Aegiribacteria sp. MLS_C]|nr:MAG: anaerobic ribonucleoside triphosphate reductase [Candidatus Aegiribacteria sp. MLS_C]